MQRLNHNDAPPIARLHAKELECGHDAMAQAVRAELEPVFNELRRFIDRRVAEISTELHATTQLMAFTEEALFGRLAEIQQKLSTIMRDQTLD